MPGRKNHVIVLCIDALSCGGCKNFVRQYHCYCSAAENIWASARPRDAVLGGRQQNASPAAGTAAKARPSDQCFYITKMAPRNKEQEQEVLNWIQAVIGEPLPAGDYEDVLKNGIVLCKLANKLLPGSVKKIQEKGTNFQLMENIQRFQAAIKKYGVPEEEIFQTADLFEKRNIPQVTLCLYALGRITQKHPEWTGPQLGPKMADKNERTFTEEQLRAHNSELNLQMGFNKGASQSGHGGFGNTRHM
ncbi:muscle-specific protein 20 [Cydia splendana]|uniref:muscle-specific protein 20 n=2 Tax=Cydia TaxID=82599 RepID=UPI00300CF27C